MALATYSEGSYIMKVTPSLWIKKGGSYQGDKFLRKNQEFYVGH